MWTKTTANHFLQQTIQLVQVLRAASPTITVQLLMWCKVAEFHWTSACKILGYIAQDELQWELNIYLYSLLIRCIRFPLNIYVLSFHVLCLSCACLHSMKYTAWKSRAPQSPTQTKTSDARILGRQKMRSSAAENSPKKEPYQCILTRMGTTQLNKAILISVCITGQLESFC